VAKRFKAKSYRAGRTHRKRIKLRSSARRGNYRVVLKVTKPGHGSQVTVTGRKL
jgi:hypothetical protein